MPRAILSGLVFTALFAACTLNTRPNTGSGGSSISECAGEGGGCEPGVSGNGGKPSEPGGGKSGQAGIGGMSVMPEAGTTPPPPPKKNDGDTCAVDADCLNNHCTHNICCASGDCCHTPDDCPRMTVDGIVLQCNDPAKCQGSGGTVVCRDNHCLAEGGQPNDSACTAKHLAKDCGPYNPVYCTGGMDQQEPACPTSCKSDADCDDDAHCDATGKCVADGMDGAVCTGDKDCVSNHCSNLICCKSGDCCINALQCTNHAADPVCDLATCTGTRQDPACNKNQCGSVEAMQNDVCAGMQVMSCGLYAPALCGSRGGKATCATSCMVDSQCIAEAFCDSGQCQPKRADGAACTASNQCQNKCNKNFCCNDSDPDSACCGVDADCAALQKSACVDKTSCSGQTTTATCSSAHRCNKVTKADPAACTQTLTCPDGFNPGTSTCPLVCGCTRNTECKAGFVCNTGLGPRGTCVKDTSVAGAGGMMSGAAGAAGGG